MKKIFQLFFDMFGIALCVVGGGYAILAVADEHFSSKRKWTEDGEIAAQLPVFQMVPGIIAGHTAVYIGRKVAGAAGAVAALAGVFLPSVIVFSAVTAAYAAIPLGNAHLDAAFLGLRAALTGILAATIVKSWRRCIDSPAAWAVLALSLAAIGPCRFNPAIVVGVSAVAGAIAAGVKGRFQSPVWMFPLVFAKYGLIAFGGGYVLVPVYLADFVGESAPYLQLAERQFADLMALTQMTPGPVAVNCATFFGYRIGETAGGGVMPFVCAFVATLALLVPGAALLYFVLGSLERFQTSRIVRGLLAAIRPVTIAMMLNALWAFASMCVWTEACGGGMEWSPVAGVLVIAAAYALCAKRIGVVRLIFLCVATAVAARAVGMP